MLAEVMLVEKLFITKGTFILECARMKRRPVRVHRSLILELLATIHTDTDFPAVDGFFL